MEKAIQDSLDMLQREFERNADIHPPLYHQQFIPPHFAADPAEETAPDSEPSDSEWQAQYRAFVAANSTSSGEWEEWHGPCRGQTYDWFGRFFGGREGIGEFRHLADSLYRVIRKIDPSLPKEGGYEACLDMMHMSAASWPTTLLKSEESVWRADHLPEDDKYDLCEVVAERDGTSYYAHPSVEIIQGNLFIAASQFAKMIAHDELTLFLSDMHWMEPDYPILGGELDEPSQGSASVSQKVGDSTNSSFLFDPKRRQWHLLFRFGPNPDDVEEEWLDDSVGLKYLAYILDNADMTIPFASVLPDTLGLKKGMAAGSFVKGSDSLHADGEPMSGANPFQKGNLQRKAEYLKRLETLRVEIEQATTDLERQELEDERDAVRTSYNSEFDKYGRSRMFLDNTETNHRRRVGNALDRFEKDCLLTEQAIASLSHFSTEFKRIRYRGRGIPGISYHQSSGVSWVVNWGEDK